MEGKAHFVPFYKLFELGVQKDCYKLIETQEIHCFSSGCLSGFCWGVLVGLGVEKSLGCSLFVAFRLLFRSFVFFLFFYTFVLFLFPLRLKGQNDGSKEGMKRGEREEEEVREKHNDIER